MNRITVDEHPGPAQPVLPPSLVEDNVNSGPSSNEL